MPGATTVPAGFSQVVVLATNSVDFNQGAVVHSGAVIVDQVSPGPTLGCAGRELCVGISVTTPSGFDVKADSIQIKSNGDIQGTAYCNDLTNNGANPGLTCQPFEPPAFEFLPPFVAQPPREDAQDVFVGSGSAVLEPGDYGIIDVNQNGSVLFTGGIYNVREIDFGKSTKFEFGAASEVRVEGKLSIDEHSTVGPAAGSGITAADIIFYVAGINGNNGNLGATPKAAKIGLGTTASANFYVPNGTLHLRQNSIDTGAFLARDVLVGPGAELSLASAFTNQSPTADPQVVETNGANALVITLTGSDPEGDDLSFSIVPGSGPTEGTLDPVVEDPVPFPGDPPGCNPANTDPCDPPEPPRTSATVTYHPTTADNLEDSFTFQVTDTSGNVGMAVVTINPPPEETEPPDPIDTVAALAADVEVHQDTPTTIVISGNAPEGVDLTFALVAGTGPDHGDASALTPGSGTPVRTASLTYTPDEGYTGDDSFDFQACGTIESVEVCDTATMSISVTVPQATADPQTLQTPENTPVTITLTGSPGLNPEDSQASGGLRAILGQVQVVSAAAVAGSVADSNGDNMGDNHNNLPGNSPFVAFAGVDQTGGAGFNGVVRYEVEWDLGGQTTTIESAEVVVTWQKGSSETLDTSFFAGTGDQDGLLTDSDFEAPVAQISGATLPVPTGSPGSIGTFTFDVTSKLAAALGAGFDYFSVKGRVDESLAGTGAQQGVPIFTSANPIATFAPRLQVESSALTFKIVSLPANGALTDFSGGDIDEVPTTLTVNRVTYTPDEGFRGIDAFTFEVDDPVTGTSATADVTIQVQFIVPGDCEANPSSCDDGRP